MDIAIACVCPPLPDGPRHEHDTVTLRDTLDLRTTLILRQTVRWMKTIGDPTDAEILAALSEAYVTYCIGAWTVVDEKGKPVAPTQPAIRGLLLSNVDVTLTVADAADALYAERVLLPLVVQGSSSSPPGRTDESTSAKNGSSPTRQKRSKPSSTSTSPMVVTGPMAASPAGVSSS